MTVRRAAVTGKKLRGNQHSEKKKPRLPWQRVVLPSSSEDSIDTSSSEEGDMDHMPRKVMSELRHAPPRLGQRGTSVPYISVAYLRDSKLN